MRADWLAYKGRSKLIMFFAGWGMDPRPFECVPARESDVVIFYDYRSDDSPALLTDACGDYDHNTLVAWSLGVAVAERECEAHCIVPDFALAINGTPRPADDLYGIPVARYDATAEALSEDSLLRFYRRMCRDSLLLKQFLKKVPERSVHELAEELQALRIDSSLDNSVFKQALVSDNDRIIPPENQFRCWRSLGVPALGVKGSHFPFYDYECWEDLIDASTQSG